MTGGSLDHGGVPRGRQQRHMETPIGALLPGGAEQEHEAESERQKPPCEEV
ncbi:MAG: hypothetical protein OHK0015_49980 [Chloroflexi bacterium OHK40]